MPFVSFGFSSSHAIIRLFASPPKSFVFKSRETPEVGSLNFTIKMSQLHEMTRTQTKQMAYLSVYSPTYTNDLGGEANSRMILAYCRLAPFSLRPLIHTVKTWAKSRNLNDSSGAKGSPTLSSYCWTLMSIAYMHRKTNVRRLTLRFAPRHPYHAILSTSSPDANSILQIRKFADNLHVRDAHQGPAVRRQSR
jgi:hypothetical protein